MKKSRYKNLDQTVRLNSFKEFRQWRKERIKKKKDLSYVIPSTSEREVDFLHSNRTIPTITWIGHSTFLIQLNGKNILTDPVWANYLGLDKRLSPPGIPIKDLPVIDIVLISHSHYDHLHYSSIRRLEGDITYFVPIGLGRWFRRKGFQNVKEFNWWDDEQFAKLHIAFVPAQHWSRRTLFDTNRSHWGGWILKTSKHTIYFVGDTGYCNVFEEVGKKYRIDYCLMPIGAYEPEWFMQAQHVNPEEAIQAFIDTNATTMIPMHYGAYRLADDTPKEALDRLCAEWERRELRSKHLQIMKLGETIRLPVSK